MGVDSTGPISRRAVLAGAASVVGAGLLAVGGVDVFDHGLFDRGLHRVGLRSSPTVHLPPSGAVVRDGSFRSRFMQGPVGWTVSHPPGGGGLQGIVFCLHGKGGNQRTAFDGVHVPDAAAHVGLRLAVAGVDGGPDSYWHRRADGTDALAMLLEEFVPLVVGMVGEHPKALMGWSMGGYGSLLAAERARSRFVAVAPGSPAMWLEPGETAPGAFDSPADFYANDVFAHESVLDGLAIAVACGTSDPFYAVTRDFVARMDFPHRAFYGPGFHDDAYWAAAAPRQLRAIRYAFREASVA